MKTIGLTGGIACGKSTVAALLRARGLPVLDADQVARAVVAPGEPALDEIVARFGPAILTADGSLDRGALGQRVVADPAAKADLEAITHPRIRERVAAWMVAQAEAGAPAAAVEAALLVETGGYRFYEALVVVSCAPAVQRARLMARNQLDAATAQRWLDAQLPLAEKERLATVVLRNDGDEAALQAAVEAAWAQIVG
jgi:dephospho-CoA kinase